MLLLNTPRKPFLSPLVLLGFLLLTACPEGPEPPQRDTTILLSVVNTGVTTVSLNVSVEDTTDTWTFGLARNDSIILSAEVTGADTVVRDGGLAPATAYRYRAYWLKNGEAVDSSAEVLATTLDTTSHRFSWTIDTLGDYGSYLNDVAIIDENNIWVVGYIKTDSATYNAARWDGREWELKKVMPQNGYVTPVESIYAFQKNNIWFGRGGLPIHWDGDEFYQYTPAKGEHPGQPSIDAIWGTSSSDIYFVGNSGSIVHYDGSGFERMESGTDVDLKDVWGVVDEETGAVHIWACGADNNPDYSVILALINGKWQTIYERFSSGNGNTIDDEPYFSPKATTIWTAGESGSLWVGGGWGVYTLNDKYRPTDYTYIDIENEVGYFSFPWKLRGNHENDIFIVGEYGSLFHFNGISWKRYSELQNNDHRFKSIDVTPKFIVVAGSDNSEFLRKAIVLKGNR